EVESKDVDSASIQIIGDVPWPAAQFADRSLRPDTGRKSIKQLAIERLVIELVEDTLDVLAGDFIVACFQAGELLWIHLVKVCALPTKAVAVDDRVRHRQPRPSLRGRVCSRGICLVL